MGQEIYVDCEGRSPHRAVEALRRDVGALRPGASTVVVRTRDLETLEAVMDWAEAQGLQPSVDERADAKVWLRLFVLPSQFGGLPDCTLRERRRSRGTRSTPLADYDSYAV